MVITKFEMLYFNLLLDLISNVNIYLVYVTGLSVGLILIHYASRGIGKAITKFAEVAGIAYTVDHFVSKYGSGSNSNNNNKDKNKDKSTDKSTDNSNNNSNNNNNTKK